jgi:hypothetical protein
MVKEPCCENCVCEAGLHRDGPGFGNVVRNDGVSYAKTFSVKVEGTLHAFRLMLLDYLESGFCQFSATESSTPA